MKGLRAGADHYLVKPFASEELIARLQALLSDTREGAKSLKSWEMLSSYRMMTSAMSLSAARFKFCRSAIFQF